MALPVPTTEAGRAGLAALLSHPSEALLGLDFDGTLAPIVDDPETSRAHPGIGDVLRRLGRLGVRTAVVTGRPADFPATRGDLADVPGIVILGQYGAQRWQDGTLHTPEPDQRVDEVRRRLPGLLSDLPAPAGTYVEDKGAAVAVHTRRAADPEAAFRRLRGPLENLAAENGLSLEPGRYVLELRPAGIDKGDALRGLVGELSPSVVVFGGDDLGDLAAFAEVERLREAGMPGLLVCSGSAEVTEVADRADLVVDGPAGVTALLADIAETLERAAGSRSSSGDGATA